jgi:hypothetical protein
VLVRESHPANKDTLVLFVVLDYFINEIYKRLLDELQLWFVETAVNSLMIMVHQIVLWWFIARADASSCDKKMFNTPTASKTFAENTRLERRHGFFTSALEKNLASCRCRCQGLLDQATATLNRAIDF